MSSTLILSPLEALALFANALMYTHLLFVITNLGTSWHFLW